MRCAAAGCVVVAGCAGPPRSPPPLEAGGAGVFAPASMRIHPLTHLQRQQDGSVWIIAHLELRDAWGHEARALGQVDVELYRPLSGNADRGEQVARWLADLSDPDVNAALYDAATRTYRLPLQGAPAWLGGESDRPTSARLRAAFRMVAGDGTEHALHDEFTLTVPGRPAEQDKP